MKRTLIFFGILCMIFFLLFYIIDSRNAMTERVGCFYDFQRTCILAENAPNHNLAEVHSRAVSQNCWLHSRVERCAFVTG